MKIGSVTRSIKGLFRPKKPNISRLNNPDEYYRNYTVPKRLCEGIDIMAGVEDISKKNAVELLIEAGLSKYMGRLWTEYLSNDEEREEFFSNFQHRRWIREVRRLAKEKGVDLSLFLPPPPQNRSQKPNDNIPTG